MEFDLERILHQIDKLSANPRRVATAKRFVYENIDEVKDYIKQKDLQRRNPDAPVPSKALNTYVTLVIDTLFIDFENVGTTGPDKISGDKLSPNIDRRQKIVRRNMKSKADFRDPAKRAALCKELHDAKIPLPRRDYDKHPEPQRPPKTWPDYMTMTSSSKEFKRMFDPQRGILSRDLHPRTPKKDKG